VWSVAPWHALSFHPFAGSPIAMTWAVPKTKIQDIDNHIACLNPLDQVGLQRVLFDVRELNERKRGDTDILLALVRVLCLMGRRGQAEEKLAGIENLRGNMDVGNLNYLATVYAWLGEYEKSWEVFESFVFDKASALLDNVARTAVLMGDLERLDKVVGASEKTIGAGTEAIIASAFREVIDSTGAAEFLQTHQTCVHEMIQRHQCYANPVIVTDGDELFVTVRYYLNIGAEERRELDRKVFDASEEAAVEAGFDPSPLLPYFGTEFLSIPTDGLQAVA
jgi:hypothetical protein|tara:strand:+ start:7078 stop:7914 length:837 start_codon:yes stop_codon:yes gene_type:complete